MFGEEGFLDFGYLGQPNLAINVFFFFLKNKL